MARSLVRAVVIAPDEDGKAVVVQYAAVSVFRKDTTDLPAMYDEASGGTIQSNPLITDAGGAVQAWLDDSEVPSIDFYVTTNSGTAVASGTADHVTFTAYTMQGIGSPDAVQADLALLTTLAITSPDDTVDNAFIRTQAAFDAEEAAETLVPKSIYHIVG